MFLGNLRDKEIYSTSSYSITNSNGLKEFTKPIIEEKQLKLFQDFCKKENIKRQETTNDIGENEYHIFEGINILCGSKKIKDKIMNHFSENKPVQTICVYWL